MSSHKLTDCKKFKKSLRKDRWTYVKKNRLCFKCLISTHDRDTCSAAVCDVENCGLRHHRLLHYNYERSNNIYERSASQREPVEREMCNASVQPADSSPEIVNINSEINCRVLLKIVRVNLHGPNGTISTYALLDDGSTVSLISADLTSRLGLRGRRDTLRVCGAWDSDAIVCETDVVSLKMSTCEGSEYELYARSVKELNLPNQSFCSVNCNIYSHLKDLKLDFYNENVKPELLIGQDNYHLLIPLKYRIGKLNEPCATLTPLGWCIHGRFPVTSVPQQHTALVIGDDDAQVAQDEQRRLLQELHDQVRESFTIESMGVSSRPRQNFEDVKAREHLEKTSRLIDGRWYVGLPWRDSHCKLPDSRPNALLRFKGVERKMKLNCEFGSRYRERIDHLLENDFAEKLLQDSTSIKRWYLPHFAVDNPNKKKLRLVFDAAAKTNNLSLNDYLLKGPDMLTSLFGIMLRFREYKVAVAGDIKDMFLRVKILPEDQEALSFLWRYEVNSPISTYKMTSLIFGANCSPFIAQFIRDKNAQRFSSDKPAAVEAINKQHYMDDYIDSQPDEASCMKLTQDIRDIHGKGGFMICNWVSNSIQVLNSLTEDSLATNADKLKIGQQHNGERALGLLWYPIDDTLGFDVSFKRISSEILQGKRPTKREALRVIMSIFDVYGFLSPLTINGKIILQQTWKSNIGWDEFLNEELYGKWLKWLNMLKSVGDIRLPRCYESGVARSVQCLPAYTQKQSDMNNGNYCNLELHVFSDASSQAMCAVAYWRWIANHRINVSFVASKCRVAPVKPTTIPRLELQAALMAARLANVLQSEHRIKAARRIFWCDSTTVIQWIRDVNRNYEVFVANRLGEIDELTKSSEWKYIPTSLNVSDVATRESYDATVFQKEWFSGPEFLSCEETLWPVDVTLGAPETVSCNAECTYIVQMVSENLPVPDPNRFSSWLRLLRSTAAVLKFIDKCRHVLTSECELLTRAEQLLLQYSQHQSFGEDIHEIIKCKQVKKNSRLLTLSPFLDDYGLLRVGGRIDVAVEVPSDLKQPVILDGKNYIARLIVHHYHTRAGHGNQELVVNELKQKYWLIKLRPTVKNIISNCMFCKIRKAKPEVPRMGNLPAGRVAHRQRPFTHCGVDLFGPMEVTVARHRQKRYGVLFTCLTVRAVHVEVVHSLTTDSLLMALRRMASRRGWPGYLYSDNGTNLRGADAEIRKSIQELNEEKLKTTASNYGTQWTFIPPVTPHWGGAWERLIRSIKTTLRVVLKERAPHDEVLLTLLAEVENIVNSRPLGHVSVEAGSKEALTPNHFLIGTSSNLPVLGIFNSSDFYLRKQWRTSQALADMYWKRWIQEILPEMLPRKRWPAEQQRPLAIGDLVFIADPEAPRGVWPRGIIEATFPGKDGRVRVVAVRTASGTLKRSAARVARIPVDVECCQGNTRVGNVSDTFLR